MSDLIIQDSGTLARAEIDVQITTAKAYPRSQKKFLEDAIELVTIDQDMAASCIYTLPSRSKDSAPIKGASIRLAEIAASCWGNMHAATRIIENDGKFITAQGVAWDLEKNLRISKDVKRSIVGKYGTFSQDMQVVTGNAACSIALRNAILSVVPRALIDIIYNEAVKFAIGDQKDFPTIRQKVFARLNQMGIESKRIFDFYKKQSVEEFNQQEVEELIGIGTSIKEGTLRIDSAFTFDVQGDNETESKLKSLLEINK